MSTQRPKHAPMTQFEVHDDCLQVGGMTLTRLAQRVGSTPFYAYDRQKITQRVALLRKHLPESVHLHYAMKANPMPAVVQHIATLVDGLDIASVQEMQVALDTPLRPSTISFAGPGKSEPELACAIAAGVLINMESEHEMERIARIAETLQIAARVAVRVNPDFEIKHSSVKMGGGPKQFGVDAERVPAMLKRIAPLGLLFEGFHIYSGSQNLNAASICEAQTKTIDLAARLASAAPTPVRSLNIGGGFGIPYFPGDEPLDIAIIGEHLRNLLPQLASTMPSAQVIIELGRYLVAEAGIYVCKVIERKISRGQVYLVTDGGLHHHLAASGNFGQIIRKNYPVVVGNKVQSAVREIVSVIGPLCTPLDLLADQMELAKAGEDDLIAVLQSGAYGLTASPTSFLSHPLPKEVLV